MAKRQPRADDMVHGCRLIEPLGSGGSGEVWKASDADGSLMAIKLLMSRELPKVLRFVREVEIMESIDARVALPIGNVHLPGCSRSPPSYAMPLAIPIKDYIAEQECGVVERVHILRCVANCLARLHAAGIYHCDVKPGNLFFFRDYWIFGDFGLSMRPGLRPLLAPDEFPGTRNYIAPELRGKLENQQPDWAKCDVYSFAKTAWVLLTGSKRPRSSSHDPGNPKHGLVLLSDGLPGMEHLDELLARAAARDAKDRPGMVAIEEVLDAWLAAWRPHYAAQPPAERPAPRPARAGGGGKPNRAPPAASKRSETVPV